MRLALGLALLCSLLCSSSWAQTEEELPPRPAASPENQALGEKLFQGHCAPCHGPGGEGGSGATLARPKLRHASDVEGLFRVIKRGVPGTEMPSAWQMNDREVWFVTGFVDSLGKRAPEGVPGDPVAGEGIYRGKGNCLMCHTAEIPGGLAGPDLTDVGARRSASYLRRSLLEPEADMPAEFLQVRVVTRDGKSITGVRLNEDTFTIQIRDYSDHLHSFLKEEVSEIDKQRGKSPMPGYKETLTEAELTDLVAYLVSLRGEE
ncbi:MAG: c-type cytochrome [Bryobacterales bacterium]